MNTEIKPQQNFRADSLDNEHMAILRASAVDITGAKLVNVSTSSNGKVLWVNVNGVCALRVCRIEDLTVDMAHQEQVSDFGPEFGKDPAARAAALIKFIAANIDNKALTDAQFRELVSNSLNVFPDLEAVPSAVGHGKNVAVVAQLNKAITDALFDPENHVLSSYLTMYVAYVHGLGKSAAAQAIVQHFGSAHKAVAKMLEAAPETESRAANYDDLVALSEQAAADSQNSVASMLEQPELTDGVDEDHYTIWSANDEALRNRQLQVPVSRPIHLMLSQKLRPESNEDGRCYVEHICAPAGADDRDSQNSTWLRVGTSYIWKVGVLMMHDSNKCDYAYAYVGMQRSPDSKPEYIGRLSFSQGENDDVARTMLRILAAMQRASHPVWQLDSDDALSILGGIVS